MCVVLYVNISLISRCAAHDRNVLQLAAHGCSFAKPNSTGRGAEDGVFWAGKEVDESGGGD